MIKQFPNARAANKGASKEPVLDVWVAGRIVAYPNMSSIGRFDAIMKKLGGNNVVGTPAPNTTRKTTPTTSPTTTTTAQQGLTVVGQGFTQLAPDSIGNSYANEAAVLKWNGTDSVAEEVEVTLTLTDASGTVVNSDEETVGAIFPDQTVAVSHEAQVSGAVNIRVQAIVTKTEDYSESPPLLTATGVTTTNDGYIQTTTGSLASTAVEQLQNVQAVAVYYNSANAVVGGDSTFVNFIPAAGNTSFQITGTNVIPGLASAQVYANVSNLTLANLSP